MKLTRNSLVGTPQIFPVTKFTYTTLHKRLQELAFLNRGARITITDERTGDSDSFQYEQGIIEYVKHLNRSSEPAHEDILYFSGQQEGVEVEIAIQYSSEYTENVHTYVNNINTHEGGTHLTGFKAALTRTLNDYARKNGLLKKELDTLSGEDGNDNLFGVDGNDTLYGGAGNDFLGGEAADDSLNGAAGVDILVGGAGNDVMTGGTELDFFVIALADGAGNDTITDYENGIDVVDLDGITVSGGLGTTLVTFSNGAQLLASGGHTWEANDFV